MNQAGNDGERFATIGALDVWESVWGAIERFAVEAADALERHLREGVVAARRLPADAESATGEVVIGRTRLLVHCALRCAPADLGEAGLREIFGDDTPLARIHVVREARGAAPRVEAELVADPRTRLWIAGESVTGPARLGDADALETFLWGLIADRAA